MGNHPSSSPSNDPQGSDRNGNREAGHSNGIGGHNVLPNMALLRRPSSGGLRLSRSELDKMCKPSGLYPTCSWDDRSVRRLIGDGKIAPRLSGHETVLASTDKECPICFLHYSQVNVTTCCNAHICTECFLQVRPMNEKNTPCPFCGSEQFSVKTVKLVENNDKLEKIKEEEEIDSIKPVKKELKEGEFGSTLSRVRSESLTSSELSEDSGFTMSPEERKRIEEEMREQYNHPLARRMDMEAEERRLQHDQSHRRANSERIRRTRGLLARGLLNNRGRSWNQMVRAFEQSNGEEGRVQTLDDLVVLEAAILLSMEQQAARRRNRGGNNEDGDTPDQVRGSFPHMLQALMARRAVESSNGDDDTDEDEEGMFTRRIRQRQGRIERFAGLSSEAGATAALLMRGISEEEQMEMAIAASLRESQQTENNSENATVNETEGVAANSVASATGASEPISEIRNETEEEATPSNESS